MVLKPLGSWGVFGIAAIDAAFMGIPMDPVVAGYVYANPSRFWIYSLMAAVGSALGSLVPYAIGRAGGELFLEKRIKKERLEALRNRFERQEFLALMIPAMLPPPTPFKLFVLAAGVFEMKIFLVFIAIAIGRFLRFMILSLLTIRFGPQVVHLAGSAISEHLPALLFSLGAVACVILFFRHLHLRRRAA